MRRHGGMCQCRFCVRWRRVCADNAARAHPPATLWIAECRDCAPSSSVVKTFDTRRERDRWATVHAAGHGHGVHLRERDREPRVEYPE